LKPYYEAFHNIIIEDETIDYVVETSDKYIQGRFLPDKAIDVIDMVGAKKVCSLTDTEIDLDKVNVTQTTYLG
jgi:ATP-dependent Clp protease ATP-binding subunit ClpA